MSLWVCGPGGWVARPAHEVASPGHAVAWSRQRRRSITWSVDRLTAWSPWQVGISRRKSMNINCSMGVGSSINTSVTQWPDATVLKIAEVSRASCIYKSICEMSQTESRCRTTPHTQHKSTDGQPHECGYPRATHLGKLKWERSFRRDSCSTACMPNWCSCQCSSRRAQVASPNLRAHWLRRNAVSVEMSCALEGSIHVSLSAGASRSGGMSKGFRGCLCRVRHQPHVSKTHHGPTGNFLLALRRDSRTRETESQHVRPDTGHTSCTKASRCQRVVKAGMRSLWKHPCAMVSNNFSGGNRSTNLLTVF